MRLGIKNPVTKGASSVEYGILVALIVILCIGGLASVGRQMSSGFDRASGDLRDHITDPWIDPAAIVAFRIVAEDDPGSSREGYRRGDYGSIQILKGEDKVGSMHDWNLYYDESGLAGWVFRCEGKADKILANGTSYNSTYMGYAYNSGVALDAGSVYKCQILAP
jgi:Flp pilus assembly pilin Flp